MGDKVVILGYASSVHVIKWVRGMADRGYDITCISLGGQPIEGVDTIIIPHGSLRRAAYLTNMNRVKRLTRKINPRLVHAHYATGYGLWGYWTGLRPFVISVWGADVIDFPSSTLKRAIVAKIIHRADYLTSTSAFLKQKTIDAAPETKGKITIIPFGVTIPAQVSKKSSNNLTRLVFIKMHYKKYGPEVLLKAFHIVLSKGYKASLSMAGEGPLTPVLKELTKKLSIEHAVSFDGYVPNDRIYDYLMRHDIMVMPSVMESESFGVAVLEAGACGLPVIASDIGGVSEVIDNGQTGFMVPPDDPEALAESMITLIKDYDLRDKMGAAGRKFVKDRYRWDYCADKMAQLYDRLIKRGS